MGCCVCRASRTRGRGQERRRGGRRAAAVAGAGRPRAVGLHAARWGVGALPAGDISWCGGGQANTTLRRMRARIDSQSHLRTQRAAARAWSTRTKSPPSCLLPARVGKGARVRGGRRHSACSAFGRRTPMPVTLALNLTSFASPSFSEEPRNPYGDSDCIFS